MMKPEYIPSTYSPNWNVMVDHRLREGFGVEDIALQMKSSVDIIRFRVRRLRETGDLMKMMRK